MVVDTSALVAILEQEPEGPVFARLIADAERVRLSAASLLEASMVMRARRPEGERDLDMLVDGAGIEIVPVDRVQVLLAREAFARYGKGNEVAALNFGDLFAYALARHLGEPLLFKGGDFARTDLTAAR